MPFPAPTNDLEWATLGDEIKSRWNDAADKARQPEIAVEARQTSEPEPAMTATTEPQRTTALPIGLRRLGAPVNQGPGIFA